MATQLLLQTAVKLRPPQLVPCEKRVHTFRQGCLIPASKHRQVQVSLRTDRLVPFAECCQERVHLLVAQHLERAVAIVAHHAYLDVSRLQVLRQHMLNRQEEMMKRDGWGGRRGQQGR